MSLLARLKHRIAAFNRETRPPALTALELFRYVGPGLLVTVGFIDPGNWAANISSGAQFGNTLLWVITLSTLMLIVLQHNAAHLGIATGLCISEAATRHLPPLQSRLLVGSAVLAAISTAVAEILGAAIALNMLFRLPIKLGALLTSLVVAAFLFTNSYKRTETVIIGFVSIIGLAFIYELYLIPVDWPDVMRSWITPSIPDGSILLIMSVLGAVVMPHNLFLHSEIIQSRQWNLEDEATIQRQLKYEFLDTLFSMGVGWAINSAMIIVAATTFYVAKTPVTELPQAADLLKPLVGHGAALVFAFALLCAGIASSITAGIAGGSIFAGLFHEPYDIRDKHSRLGVGLVLGLALVAILLIENTLQGLVLSQVMLSVQLPFTIYLLVRLTSSVEVMGARANSPGTRYLLVFFGAIVTFLNLYLLFDLAKGALQ
ncbi:manganese transport protein [Formivibrio citricus]|uniref:Manganese transport protein n=1 Tax=Formivibrio citricus TaxID=83765 RepID=A0A1I5DFI9_9NEIS|nr:Nramp family divalent metal transporter [Formivibrio citricus]SFN97887.1 manganese transport protein [Formivibrio citricus]